MVRAAVAAPGGISRAMFGAYPELHSPGSLTRRKTAFTWTAPSFWSETFLSLNETAGTILFLPPTVPASAHPVVTESAATAFARSTERAHPLASMAAATNTARFMVGMLTEPPSRYRGRQL